MRYLCPVIYKLLDLMLMLLDLGITCYHLLSLAITCYHLLSLASIH